MKNYIVLIAALTTLACGNPEEDVMPSLTTGDSDTDMTDMGGFMDKEMQQTGGGGGGTSSSDGDNACTCEAAEPGAPGKDGSSCSVTQEGDETRLTCTDGTSSVLAKGESIVGPSGEDGVDGTSCSVAQDGVNAKVTCTDGTSATLQSIVGPQGMPGTSITGPAGPTGATGATGPKGDTGSVGPKGDKGNPGNPGSDGADGKSFTDADYYVVYGYDGGEGSGQEIWASAYCSGTDVAVAGGCAIGTGWNETFSTAAGTGATYGGWNVNQVSTDPSNFRPRGWDCKFTSLGLTRTLRAKVVCAIDD